MGIALAEECAQRGAEVQLILGPSMLDSSYPNVHITKVQSSEEMYEACLQHHSHSDIAIFAAAVADYRPQSASETKIKKSEATLELKLEKTIDIAKSLGELKKNGQIHIGFALETNDEESFAQVKLKKKNFDLIVLNSLNDKGAGFQVDTNKVTIFSSDDEMKKFELKSKKDVARDIMNTLVNKYLKS